MKPGERLSTWATKKEILVAIIDVAGFISAYKDHAVEHGFHVHDERHFVETYSMRQNWEVDLHPEEACGGPLDLHLSLEIEPRTVLAFEDHLYTLSEDAEPDRSLVFPMHFTWSMPPLPNCPDLLILATDLAGIGGPDLPIEVTAIDSFASVTDSPERSITIIARVEVSLADIFMAVESSCETLEQCQAVSRYLLENAERWLAA